MAGGACIMSIFFLNILVFRTAGRYLRSMTAAMAVSFVLGFALQAAYVWRMANRSGLHRVNNACDAPITAQEKLSIRQWEAAQKEETGIITLISNPQLPAIQVASDKPVMKKQLSYKDLLCFLFYFLSWDLYDSCKTVTIVASVPLHGECSFWVCSHHRGTEGT